MICLIHLIYLICLRRVEYFEGRTHAQTRHIYEGRYGRRTRGAGEEDAMASVTTLARSSTALK